MIFIIYTSRDSLTVYCLPLAGSYTQHTVGEWPGEPSLHWNTFLSRCDSGGMDRRLHNKGSELCSAAGSVHTAHAGSPEQVLYLARPVFLMTHQISVSFLVLFVLFPFLPFLLSLFLLWPQLSS